MRRRRGNARRRHRISHSGQRDERRLDPPRELRPGLDERELDRPLLRDPDDRLAELREVLPPLRLRELAPDRLAPDFAPPLRLEDERDRDAEPPLDDRELLLRRVPPEREVLRPPDFDALRPLEREVERPPVERDVDRPPVERDVERRPLERDVDRRPVEREVELDARRRRRRPPLRSAAGISSVATAFVS